MRPLVRDFALTNSRSFIVHSYIHDKKDSIHLVFLPGLGESKAGLYYVFHQWALFFYKLGYSCHLLDLAGNGDSTLTLDFSTWSEQIQILRCSFDKQKIVWVSRGLSSYVLPREKHLQECVFAINPTIPNFFRNFYKDISTIPNCLEVNHITPQNFKQLTHQESLFWHNLGAEAECIGSLSLPSHFFQKVFENLYFEIPEFWHIFQSQDFYLKNHPNLLGKDLLLKSHPLFFLETDRLNMRNLIHETLIKNEFTTEHF